MVEKARRLCFLLKRESTLIDLRERQLRQERLLSSLLMLCGVAPLDVGMAIGAAAAAGLARWVSSLLFGVSGADPLTMAAAVAVLLLVAAVAAALPARAAVRVDPVLTRRQ
jgi:ABC-type antimicrobial peptide transport system permease subunit